MLSPSRLIRLVLQGFESYKGRVQSLMRMLQIGRGMLQESCGSLQPYREVLDTRRLRIDTDDVV